MPGIEARADPQELRRCIRDLTALSALPPIWRAYDPHQIAESASAAMLLIIDCEFVHVSLPDKEIKVARVGRGVDPGSAAVIAIGLQEQLPRQPDGQTVISVPLNEGTLPFAFAPIGFGDNAVLVAASRRSGFPTEVHQLLLSTCANYVSLELDRWDAEMHQRRFVGFVERSSDLIGFASLDGTTQYLNPAALEFMSLSHLDGRRPNVLDYIHPEDRVRVRDELWPVMMQEGRWVGEVRLRHFATGAGMPFFVGWFRIDDPRSAQPMNIAAVCRDLTTQKRSEAELLHLNETVEQRVAARTRELADANLKLVAESIERRRMDTRRSASRSSKRMAATSTASQIPEAEQFSASPLRPLEPMMPTKPVVHVVDDDAAIRRSLERLLASAGFTPVSYETPLAFLAAASERLAGCILLDLWMPGMDGLEVQVRLRQMGILLPVIVMTAGGDVQTAVRAMKAGAIDFIEKPFDDEVLLSAIEASLAPAARGDRADKTLDAARRLAALSPRERQVLDALLAGRPNKVIAYDLGLSVRTVEVHRAHMMERLGVRQLSEAIRLAVMAKLVSPLS